MHGFVSCPGGHAQGFASDRVDDRRYTRIGCAEHEATVLDRSQLGESVVHLGGVRMGEPSIVREVDQQVGALLSDGSSNVSGEQVFVANKRGYPLVFKGNGTSVRGRRDVFEAL